MPAAGERIKKKFGEKLCHSISRKLVTDTLNVFPPAEKVSSSPISKFIDAAISRSIETSAIFFEALLEVPLNITSSIPEPRILFADVSPITHLKDSTILDFPHPLGPTIPVRPSSIRKFVLSAKDLNPFNWIFLNSMH